MIKVLFSQLKDAFSVVKLDDDVMLSVAKRKSSTKWGIFFLVLPSLFSLVLSAAQFPSSFSVIFSRFLFWPIFIPVLAFLGCVFFMEVVAGKLFGGNVDRIGFFRVLSYGFLSFVLAILPFLLSFFVGIDSLGWFNLISIAVLAWMIVISYRFLSLHYKISAHDLLFIIVSGGLAYFVIRAFLGFLLVGKSYRLFY